MKQSFRTTLLTSLCTVATIFGSTTLVFATSTEQNMNRLRVEMRASTDTPDGAERPEVRREGDSVEVRQRDRVNDPTEPRGAFLDMRARWMSADDVERVGLRADMMVRARAFLQQRVDVLIEKLTRLKQWVADHPRVSDDLRRDVAERVDEEIASLRQTVASLDTDDITLEDIQTMAQRVRSRMSSYHETILRIVAQIKEHRIETEQERLLSLVTTLETYIAEKTAEGIDLSAQTRALAAVKTDIADAETSAEIRVAFQSLKQVLSDIRGIVIGVERGSDETAPATDA